MAVRKAYIDWKRLDKNSGLISGKEYMCFSIDRANMAGCIGFARYYNKGDVVKLALREDYRPNTQAPTAEQRLLDALFGRTKTYIVPVDGLYQQTGDYGVDEKCENGAFKGCSEQLVLAGNTLDDDTDGAIPVFWAECPVLPEGYTLFEDIHPPRTQDGEALSDLRLKLEQSKAAMYVYQGLCGHSQDKQALLPGDDGSVNVYIKGAVCSVTPQMAANLVLSVQSAAAKIAMIPEGDVMNLNVDITGAPDRETATRIWHDFMEKHSITVKESSYALMAVTAIADRPAGFYACRDKILARKTPDALDNVRVVIEAYGKSHLPGRIARLARLMRLNAPDIILMNELRMACEIAAAWKFTNTIIHVTQDFSDSFGINPDGTRSSSCSEVGDAELYRKFLDSQDCDHNCDGCDVRYCEERDGPLPESVIPAEPEPEDNDKPRFVPAYMPNFMMRVPGVIIVDSETDTFVRDENGEIEVWVECPRDRLEELNKNA